MIKLIVFLCLNIQGILTFQGSQVDGAEVIDVLVFSSLEVIIRWVGRSLGTGLDGLDTIRTEGKAALINKVQAILGFISAGS